MGRSYRALLIGALTLAGCGGAGDRPQQGRDTGGTMSQMDSGAMGGHGMQMMAGMRAHMDSMMRMPSQQMQAMMAMHQSMISQMMDRLGADMRGMQMSGSPEWDALTDSVKQDLAELPALHGPELSARMEAHARRVKRLLTMHETMMGNQSLSRPRGDQRS